MCLKTDEDRVFSVEIDEEESLVCLWMGRESVFSYSDPLLEEKQTRSGPCRVSREFTQQPSD